jgi:hypothetical protein
MRVQVTFVTFTPAPWLDRLDGLLGWVDITLYGAILIENVAVRRSRVGKHYLSFPTREVRHGRRSLIRPVDNDARLALEHQVLHQLRERGEIAA